MSPTNVELARNAWTSESFTALFDEFVVVDMRENTIPGLPTIALGRDEVEGAFRSYWESWDEYGIEPVEFIDAGQSVVVIVREHGRGKGSGVPVDRAHFQVWTFRSERLIRWEAYANRSEALQAAGLNEKRGMGNIELALRALGAIREGDIETAREVVADDFVWRIPGDSPIAGEARGVDEWSRKFRKIVEAGLKPEVLATLEGDDHAAFVQQNTAESGGRSLDVRVVNLFTIEAGKLARMDTFFDDQASLDAFWTGVLGGD
jgi:ketosteroid isomerase-like protein